MQSSDKSVFIRLALRNWIFLFKVEIIETISWQTETITCQVGETITWVTEGCHAITCQFSRFRWNDHSTDIRLNTLWSSVTQSGRSHGRTDVRTQEHRFFWPSLHKKPLRGNNYIPEGVNGSKSALIQTGEVYGAKNLDSYSSELKFMGFLTDCKIFHFGTLGMLSSQGGISKNPWFWLIFL